MRKTLCLLILAMFLTACGGNAASSNSANSAAEKPMPVGAFLTEYKKDKAATKTKYTGKPLTVRGWAGVAPIMPNGATDDGILTIMEKGGEDYVTCYFKQSDKEEFSKITGGQMVTLKGVFDDSMSTGLRECKVVSVE